jgi:hypothetical protein
VLRITSELAMRGECAGGMFVALCGLTSLIAAPA